MIPYVVVFVFVLLIAIFIDNKRTPNIIKKAMLVVIILTLSLFGGMRSYDTGIDLKVYGVSWFERAEKSVSFRDYVKKSTLASGGETKDVGYLYLNYVVAKTTGNLTAFLVLLQTITNAPILIVLYRKRNKNPFALSLLIYLCLFYCRNFNMMRQGAAISLVFLASGEIRERKIKNFLLLSIIAYSMHSTAIIMTITQILIALTRKMPEFHYRRVIKGIFAGSLIFVFMINTVLLWLYNAGLITNRYYHYIDTYSNKGFDLPVVDFIMLTIMTLPSLVVFFCKKNNKTEREEITDQALSIEGLILYLTRLAIVYSDRLSLYFQYHVLIASPAAMKQAQNKRQITLRMLIFVVAAAAYWFVKNVIFDAYGIMPYRTAMV